MISLLANLRVKFLSSVLVVYTFIPCSFAANDVLETPAAQSTIAHQNLLLDVTAVSERLVAVGARGHILISEDDGDNWRQIDTPVSVLLTGVSFSDTRNGWAVGHGGVILNTRDGGDTWTKQFDGNAANQSNIKQAQDVVTQMEANLDAASEEDAEDLEYELEEAQFALEDAQIDAAVGASKPFLDVYFYNKDVGFVVGAYGYIFKTVDGGITWENYGSRMDNADRFHLNTITRVQGGAYLIAGEAGVMFRSDDEGESWDTVNSPYDGSFFGLMGTGDEGVALAFGLRGNLFRSEDAGVSWEALDSGTESTLMGGSYDGSGKVSIVGNSGTVLLSKDGGKSFSETIRANRLGNVSLVYVDGRRLALVGESGVSITSPAGKNL